MSTSCRRLPCAKVVAGITRLYDRSIYNWDLWKTGVREEHYHCQTWHSLQWLYIITTKPWPPFFWGNPFSHCASGFHAIIPLYALWKLRYYPKTCKKIHSRISFTATAEPHYSLYIHMSFYDFLPMEHTTVSMVRHQCFTRRIIICMNFINNNQVVNIIVWP